MTVHGPSAGYPRFPTRLPPVAPSAPRAPEAPAAAQAAAPEGRDPALWSVLTPEERDFFLQQAALGPVTYGPGSHTSPSASAPVGQRLDVRA